MQRSRWIAHAWYSREEWLAARNHPDHGPGRPSGRREWENPAMTLLPSYSALSHLECARCGRRLDADQVQGTCSCGSPLLARYDLGRVAAQLSHRDIAARQASL